MTQGPALEKTTGRSFQNTGTWLRSCKHNVSLHIQAAAGWTLWDVMFLILYLVCSTLLLLTSLCEDTLHFIMILPLPSCQVPQFWIVSKFAREEGKPRNRIQQLFEWHVASKTQVVWRHLCEQGVLHSGIACIQTVLLIPVSEWVLSDLSFFFFPPLPCSEFLSQIFVKAVNNRASGEGKRIMKWSHYPVTLTLGLAATQVVKSDWQTRTTSQSLSQTTTGHVD